MPKFASNYLIRIVSPLVYKQPRFTIFDPHNDDGGYMSVFIHTTCFLYICTTLFLTSGFGKFTYFFVIRTVSTFLYKHLQFTIFGPHNDSGRYI